MSGKPQHSQKFFDTVVLAWESDECLLWPFALTGEGYPALGDKGVHRILCERRDGPRPRHIHAAHDCGEKRCVNLRHVHWKTPAENEADKLRHGTRVQGERHYRSKVSDAEAEEICQLKATMPLSKLAARYGMTPAGISKITTGVNRKASGAVRLNLKN